MKFKHIASRRGSRVLRLLLEHQSDFQVLEIFKLPIEKGVIIECRSDDVTQIYFGILKF